MEKYLITYDKMEGLVKMLYELSETYESVKKTIVSDLVSQFFQTTCDSDPMIIKSDLNLYHLLLYLPKQ